MRNILGQPVSDEDFWPRPEVSVAGAFRIAELGLRARFCARLLVERS
jgi:hypothetical protein